MKPLKRNTLSEQIMSSVLDYISEHNLQTGDKLPTEKELSEKLQVGRNSIREVMKTLNLAGITESIPGKGTFLLKNADGISYDSASLIRAVDGASLLEVIEVRRIIETEAAAMAAVRVRDNLLPIKELERTYSVLIRALDERKKDVSAEGFDFHMEIVRSSGNHLLYQMFSSIVTDIRKAKKLIHIDLDNSDYEKKVHTDIFKAIAEGNPERARAAVLAHFANTQVYYSNYAQNI